MKFPRVAALLVLALALLPLQPAAAQTPETFTWSVYSALNSVQGGAFDQQGIFWLGTTGGAVGYSSAPDSFRVYRTTEGLLSLNVTALAVDPATDDIYMGSDDGLISILRANGRWSYATEIATMNDRPSRRITGFGFHEGRVYVLTDFGVGVFNPADSNFIESYFRFGPVPQNTPVRGIAFWDDRIWLGTDKGLVYAPFDGRNLAVPGVWSQYITGADSAINSIVPFENGLLIGTNTGAYVIDAVGSRPQGELPRRKVILASSGEHVVAGSERTVYRYEGGRFVEAATSADNVTAVAISSQGEIGVGFVEQGFALLQDGALRVKSPNAPAGNFFGDLTIATDGALWNAHSRNSDPKHGISRLKGETWTRFNRSNTPEFQENSFWNVGAGTDGSVWAGGYGHGAVMLKPADSGFQATSYDEQNSSLVGVQGGNFVVVGKSVTDANGRTWIVNYDPQSAIGPILVMKLRPNEESNNGTDFMAFDDFLNKSRIFRWVAIDDNGTKWLASTEEIGVGAQGLYAFNERDLNDPDDDIWIPIMTDKGLGSNQTMAVAVDRLGEVWVGTNVGISVLINPSSTVFSQGRPVFRTIRPLADILVRAIAVDALNRKWVGTSQGLFLLSPEGDVVLQKFTEANSPLVSNDVRSIVAEDATGDIYIGTANGLNRISTTAVRSPDVPEIITVWPQPYVLPSAEPLRIKGLPANAIVKIYGAGWTLIREFRSPGGSVALWDGLDNSGKVVPSGVYIIGAGSESGDNVVVGKVAVIRQ